MVTEWIVQSVEPNNGIRRIHLTRDSGRQPEHFFLNVLPETVPGALSQGDVCGVTFTLIRRRGSNGQ